MYIEQISIRNFRLFEKLDLHLNKGLNVLVGENNSGKTALIDAIRYTLGTNCQEKNYIQESDFFNDSAILSIQLKFVAVEKNAHVFVEHLTHEENNDGEHKYNAVLYVQYTAKKTGQEIRGYPFIKTELRSGKDGNGLLIDTEIRNFLSATYLKPLRDAESELSAGKASRLSQILNSSKALINPTSIEDILKIIAEANSNLLAESGLIHNISQQIQNKYLYKLIFEEDKNLLAAIIDIAGVKQESLEKLSDSEKRNYIRHFFEKLSLSLTRKIETQGLGYQNLLFMAAELLLLEQESDNEFPLLLIEEPEAHLHPQLQMKLLQFINEKIKTDSNPDGIQCLLTTHSPNLSSKANPADVIIMYKGKAFPLQPGKTELAKDDYMFLQKFLDVTKANLFFAKGVLLVEGPSEQILLPTIAKLLGVPLENYGISIIQYNNSGSWKRFAKLFLRKQNNHENDDIPIKVAVLRDLDLLPHNAEKSKYKYGFIEKNDKNASRWICDYTDVSKRIKKLKAGLEKQKVKVFISEDWTFEFCLAKSGLHKECYRAIGGKKILYKEFNKATLEDKATYIQSKVKKTDFAYKLSKILEKRYKNNRKLLIQNLPSYLIDAIAYLIGDPTLQKGQPTKTQVKQHEPVE